MKRFKDYFQDKIEKVPSWLGFLRKFKNKKTSLEGDAIEGGNKDHQSTERLEDV